jgi:hypothetical protein|tara:strand:- start:2800 stop:2952 length:153 start_codon:yes stop_codon:yes gene_type:complete
MVINDLDVACASLVANETNTPLLIDPNRMLPESIRLETLQAIPRRHLKII